MLSHPHFSGTFGVGNMQLLTKTTRKVPDTKNPADWTTYQLGLYCLSPNCNV